MKPRPLYDLEAEKAVLGSVIIENDALVRVHDLQEEDFWLVSHRLIYRAMRELLRKGSPIDLITLRDQLGADLDRAGGVIDLARLADSVPASTFCGRYAQIVKRLAALRRLKELSSEIAEQLQEAEDPHEVCEYIQRALLTLETREHGDRLTPGAPVLEAVLDRIEALQGSPRELTGLATGLTDLDRLLSGLQPGDLVIVAARPSMGKSALAGGILRQTAILNGQAAVYFSLEMPSEQLMTRFLAQDASVDIWQIRHGRLREDSWTRIIEAASRIYEAPIYLDDTPALTLEGLRLKCLRLAREAELKLIVVDYLQLMGGRDNAVSREQAISEISRGLKALAKELNLPVVALSQLNRAVEARPDKRPMMSDLRESGAIEQDADVIVLLYREAVYRQKEAETDDELRSRAEAIVAKQRNGPTGTTRLYFQGETASFQNLEVHHV